MAKKTKPKEDRAQCDNCGKCWPLAELDGCHDFWSRATPGCTIPAGDCPDDDCGSFCYPMDERKALRDALPGLLALAKAMLKTERAVKALETASTNDDEHDRAFDLTEEVRGLMDMARKAVAVAKGGR